MFEYSVDVDCAYFSLAKPISTTVCEEITPNVILEFDATKTLVGVELLFLRQLLLPDLEPLKRFLSQSSYHYLLENINAVKSAHNN